MSELRTKWFSSVARLGKGRGLLKYIDLYLGYSEPVEDGEKYIQYEAYEELLKQSKKAYELGYEVGVNEKIRKESET